MEIEDRLSISVYAVAVRKIARCWLCGGDCWRGSRDLTTGKQMVVAQVQERRFCKAQLKIKDRGRSFALQLVSLRIIVLFCLKVVAGSRRGSKISQRVRGELVVAQVHGRCI